MTPEAAGLRALHPLLVLLGLYHLALGLFMVLAPGAFFDQVGPFGGQNDHYVRDVATFYLALGAVLLLAAERPGWRVPILAYAMFQYGLHAINHLADVGQADPSWLGPADFVSLLLLTVLLGWLLAAAARSDRQARR
jgi:hypothetical protein